MSSILKFCIASFMVCMMVGQGPCAAAAEKDYDYFYNNSKKFREADNKLNQVYQEALAKLPLSGKRVLRKEQRFWHNTQFKDLLKDIGAAENIEEAATRLVRERSNDLGKLQKTSQALLGMPIKFGMTKAQVCESLGIVNDSICKSISNKKEENRTYIRNILDENIKPEFTFLNTTFYQDFHLYTTTVPDYKPLSSFLNYIFKNYEIKDLLISDSENNHIIAKSQNISRLVGVSGKFNNLRHEIVLGNFAKRYKLSFVKDTILKNNLDKYFKIGVGDDGYWGSLYAEKNKYIYVDINRAPIGYYVRLNYIDKRFADSNISSVEDIESLLKNVRSFEKSLGILSEYADINEILRVFGGRKIKFESMLEGYSELVPTINPDYASTGDEEHTMEIYLNNDKKAYAIEVSITDLPYKEITYELLLEYLQKKYESIDDDSMLCKIFKGCSFEDPVFDVGENYIFIRNIPHYAIGYNLVVVNKQEARKYYEIFEKHNRNQKRRSEKLARELENF